MTTAGLTVPTIYRSSRWLLLISLALNLFFIGVGGALLLQGVGFGVSGGERGPDRTIGVRIQRIAATLPREDGDKLRAAYQADRQAIEETYGTYRRLQDKVREALRAQPFNVTALRAAMEDMQIARQTFDRHLQDFFARLAPEFSEAGRQKLADWRGSRRAAQPRPSSNGDR